MIARYRSGETLAVGWALIGVALVAVFAISQSGFSGEALLVAILVALVAWLVAIRPAIIVHEHALVIQNVIRKHEIPWSTITQISSTLLVTVRTEDGRKISAWAISSSVKSRALGRTSKGDEIALELERYRMAYGS
jgi:hypothetical protein